MRADLGTERFSTLIAAATPLARRCLGALALERSLTRAQLVKLARAPIAEWLAQAIEQGLVVASAMGELSVHRDFEQQVLRELAKTNALEEIARDTAHLLEAASVAKVSLAIQYGDLDAFVRLASARRLPRAVPLPSAAEWLRRSICEPFDERWLARTFGDGAVQVVERVLRESLAGPSACEGAYAWARARPVLQNPTSDDVEEGRLSLEDVVQDIALEELLFEHALLRGERADESSVLSNGHRAAARFCAGDLATAQRLLDALVRDGNRVSPSHGALGPIVAMLLCARDDEPSLKAARRILSASTRDGDKAAARAFSAMAKSLRETSVESRRFDVHQVDEGAGAWELLLTAFAAHVHTRDPVARAAWSVRLTRSAIAWSERGYRWLAKQAVLLAQELDADYCRRELDALPDEARAQLRVASSDLSLWMLVAPKPEWRRALDALAAVSANADRAEGALRVAWYLDMSDGSIGRPALQEHRPGAGYSAGKRMSVAELWERREELPPEDARVLACSRETRKGERELTPDAHEMLVGHPRVFDGARGGASVEVVRGTCRVETHESQGHIQVIVEPAGARPGVNVVVESPSRVVVYRVTSTMQRVIAALPHGVRVPKAHEAEVLRILGKLADDIEVKSPLLAVEREVEAKTTPCVRIAPVAGAWVVQLGVRPFGDEGRFFVAGEGARSVTLQEGGRRLRCVRDLATERARVDALIAACTTLARPPEAAETTEPDAPDRWFFGEPELLALLSDLRDCELEFALEWPESAPLVLRGRVSGRSLRVNVKRLRTRKGWYLATGGVRLDDVSELALAELARATPVGNGRFVRLPNGEFVELEARVRAVMANLKARGDKALEIPSSAIATLEVLSEGGVELDHDAASWLARVDAASRATFEVPRALQATLRPYQIEGFEWLCRLSQLGLGACLADDMGLGKTLQILAFLLTRASDGPALVVAPTSVCSNWVREAERFAPTLKVVEYAGAGREEALQSLSAKTLVICSYALLQQNRAALSDVEWSTAVLDEAQFIKNAESLRAQAAFALNARQRIVATGTPVENHFGDLWSLFQFLNPGLLGDWPSFKRRFVQPLESGASAALPADEAPDLVLRRLVRPYILRRRKEDVLRDLPPVTELQHDVHLSEQDAMRYALLRKRIHEKLFTAHGRRHTKLQVLAELTRLRRFCCHPRLVFPDSEPESAKIDAFLSLAEELRENGHRALVFSQFVDFLSLVREQLDERRIDYEYLDGSTPAADRQARVDAFQQGRASLFLISLKAGGFGLNLTAADYVIHLDPWWNPAVEAQATDRAHRIGQERRVTVYRLVTKNTIEEQIVALHQKKQQLARTLLDDAEGAPSQEDLMALLAP